MKKYLIISAGKPCLWSVASKLRANGHHVVEIRRQTFSTVADSFINWNDLYRYSPSGPNVHSIYSRLSFSDLEQSNIDQMLRRFYKFGRLNAKSRIEVRNCIINNLDRYLPDISCFDCIVFPFVPHHYWDYLVYLSAKKSFIPTIILEKTDTVNHVIVKENIYTNALKITDHKLLKMDGKYIDGYQFWTQRKLTNAERLLNKIFKHVKGRNINSIKKNMTGMLYPGIYFGSYHDYEALRKLNTVQICTVFMMVVMSNCLINSVRKWISTKAPRVNGYSVAYLQTEPEKAICPQGGGLNTNIMWLKSIRKKIKHDEMLYVKEHPGQVKYFRSLLQADRLKLYMYILFAKNLKMLEWSASRADLALSANKNFVFGGSIGLECMKLGATAHITGFPWYRGYVTCNEAGECRFTSIPVLEMDYDDTVKADKDQTNVFVKYLLAL